MSTSRLAPWVAPLGVAAVLLVAAGAQAAKPPPSLQLAPGARVGVVNLLSAEVTHYHASRQLQDSFLKTYPVRWPLPGMLLGAVRERLTQLGLSAVPVPPGEELNRARESCFLDAALARGLPKECGPPFAHLAAAEHLDALIVLGPGRNDATHAGSARHRGLPEYLRGWCFVSGEGAGQGAPLLLNLTELLLIGADRRGVQLFDREWGGDGPAWTGYQPPPDPKVITEAQLTELQGLFAETLRAQAGALLTHLEVAR
jgi:hypothetical protein